MATGIGARRTQPPCVAHHRVPGHINVAIRRHVRCRIAIVAKSGVRHGNNVHELGHRYGAAPSVAAVSRLDHPYAVEGSQARRSVPKHIDGTIWTDHWTRALAIQHITDDQLRTAEGLAGIP